MAILEGTLKFTGKLGDVTAYRLPGSNKIHVRTTGGVSRERIKTDPSFELTRKNAIEFGGCGKAAALFRQAILPVAHLREKGTKVNSATFKLIKVIQKKDIVRVRGTRAIKFSDYKNFLRGFNLHGKLDPDRLLGLGNYATVNRSTGTATVTIPELEHRLWPYAQLKQPMYRFIIHLGVLPDLFYMDGRYTAPGKPDLPYASTLYTPWRYTGRDYAQEQFKLQLESLPLLQNNMTLLLSIGIEMGSPLSEYIIKATPGAGCARVLLAV